MAVANAGNADFGIMRTGRDLVLFGRVDEQCEFHFVDIRLDPTTGQIVGTTDTESGMEGTHGPYVPGGPEVAPAPQAPGLRWDATGRVVSDQGWSVQVDPARGPVPALVTSDVVYLVKQGRNYLSCSY